MKNEDDDLAAVKFAKMECEGSTATDMYLKSAYLYAAKNIRQKFAAEINELNFELNKRDAAIIHERQRTHELVSKIEGEMPEPFDPATNIELYLFVLAVGQALESYTKQNEGGK